MSSGPADVYSDLLPPRPEPLDIQRNPVDASVFRGAGEAIEKGRRNIKRIDAASQPNSRYMHKPFGMSVDSYRRSIGLESWYRRLVRAIKGR